jgi:Amt family ammonium transporter
MAATVTVPSAEWLQLKTKMEEFDAFMKATPAPAPNTFNSGDTAWILTSTALVLFMCLPGLALYYGGQTQAKNVLSTVAQTFSLACMITILWLMMGYSLCFSTGSAVYGDASRFWFIGTNDAGNQKSPYRMNVNSAHIMAPTIPEAVFMTYQVWRACICKCCLSVELPVRAGKL